MTKANLHTFHVPVMGLGFTIDTPLKVARFGISSVISIMEDELIEQMRKFHCEDSGKEYVAIESSEEDYRARRITAYLNLIHELVIKQFDELLVQPFTEGSDIVTYFELLPDESPVKQLYKEMVNAGNETTKASLQNQLRAKMEAGSIDVNILSKADKTNYNAEGEPLPKEFSDALSALRGFANSTLNSSIVFSAGYNPRLYAYVENFEDFFPDDNGAIKKKITLKVSDYRSALVQGKIFAKKGLWISEFRIESGLNCGGHAFATDGLLLGPVLEEFKTNRQALTSELQGICNGALIAKGKMPFIEKPETRITVQGGLGTANEHKFLLEHYQMDSIGWGSPFLLVPEVTNVDSETLQALATAKQEDYYLSNSSPLGVPFNNFRRTTSEKQRQLRITKGRPGSPCYKNFLSTNTEFTLKPICTASREYQYLKIKQLSEKGLPPAALEAEKNKIMEKECLCEGLGAPALLKNHVTPLHKLTAVAVCPGPNLAYFSGIFSLKQMAEHIYGKINILNSLKRSNMFVNELKMYISYLKKKIEDSVENISNTQFKDLQSFHTNLLQGIAYYENLVSFMRFETFAYKNDMKTELEQIKASVMEMVIPALIKV